MRKRIAAALVALCLAPAHAAPVGWGGALTPANPNVPAGAIPWSMLGIVADGVTDNTASLNAICSASCDGTKTIYCDTGAANTVLVAGQWLLASNLMLYAQNCPISLTSGVTGNTGVITQSAINTPLSGVLIDGLNVARPALNCGLYPERLFMLYANHFTLTNWRAANYCGLMFLRGGDIEIGHGSAVNSASHTGYPGIRLFANLPAASATGKPTIEGVPCNVWIHDNFVSSGDAAYQIDPSPPGGTVWPDEQDSDGVCYVNDQSASTTAPPLAVGGGTGAAEWTGYIQNFVFEGIAGSGGAAAIAITSGTPSALTIRNGLFKTIAIDDEYDVTGTPSIDPQGDPAHGGVVKSVTFDGVAIAKPYAECIRVDAGAQDITFKNMYCDAPRLSTSGATVALRSDLRTTIETSTIVAPPAGSAILAGSNRFESQSPTLSGNALLNVPNGKSGIFLANVDGAAASGNSVTPATGATNARGITFDNARSGGAGTTNSTATGNDIHLMPVPLVFTCNGGTGNSATGNTGAADQTCP